jgi:hypothetical protein
MNKIREVAKEADLYQRTSLSPTKTILTTVVSPA